MKELPKRYAFAIVLALMDLALIAIYPAVGQRSLRLTWSSALEMPAVLPFIFILLGGDIPLKQVISG